MRKWLNIYFNFSKGEFNGLLVLIVLIGIVSLIPIVYELLVPDQYDLEAEKAALQKLMHLESENRKTVYPRYSSGRKDVVKKTKLFNFDPNSASLSTWESLGLSHKQAEVMLRYTSKGGRFREKEDLKKMYVISPHTYEQLAPYIYITENSAAKYKSSGPKFAPSRYPPKRVFENVSLNSADTLALDGIKGIGPAFARRIFSYRKRLGGFHNKEQLLEVYGLDSAKYLEIKDQVSIDAREIVKIKINIIEYAELRNNPYLNPKQVNAILQYRKQHGNYGNIADLKKVVILSTETIDKLTPYISFEHD